MWGNEWVSEWVNGVAFISCSGVRERPTDVLCALFIYASRDGMMLVSLHTTPRCWTYSQKNCTLDFPKVLSLPTADCTARSLNSSSEIWGFKCPEERGPWTQHQDLCVGLLHLRAPHLCNIEGTQRDVSLLLLHLKLQQLHTTQTCRWAADLSQSKSGTLFKDAVQRYLCVLNAVDWKSRHLTMGCNFF